jgi:hypothetical protein
MGHGGSVLLGQEAVSKATGQAGERIGRGPEDARGGIEGQQRDAKAIDCATKPLQWVTATMASVA